ncbi:MAG: hypothetical protein ACF8R7_01350 [Phycisphaerales bacterium JB039]
MAHGSARTVDREARRRLVRAIRALASGLITNDEFEDRVLDDVRSSDRAIDEVFCFAWSQYDDIRPAYRLVGRDRLTRLQRRQFAICVLFLRSELPFEAESFKALTLLGQPIFAGLFRWLPRRKRAAGRRVEERLRRLDDRIWPFGRMADYKAALAKPLYLAG